MKISKKKYNSLIIKLICGTLVIITPLVFFLIFDNYYAVKLLNNKVSELNCNTIELYMNNIDSELRTIDNYLLNLVTFDSDVNNINNVDINLSVLSKVRLSNEFTNAISQYKIIDGFFSYSSVYKNYFDARSSRANYGDSQFFSNYVLEISKNMTNYNNEGWFGVFNNSSNYLVRVIYVDNLYIGVWININSLMEPLLKIDQHNEGYLLFATNTGVPMINENFVYENYIDLTRSFNDYYFSGKNRKYMVIGKKSEVGKFSLVSLTSERNILQGLNFIQIVISIIAIISIMAIPITLLILRKWIFSPIINLRHAINKVEAGDLEYRIEEKNYSNEFNSLNRAFNSMTSQIKELKINIYEDKINKEKLKLQYLQMQIRPHFYLNALNNIYSMSQTKEFELIQQMVLHLSSYLRYILKDNFIMVTLEDEISHIKNYLKIQKIHSGELLNCTIDYDEDMLNIQIPPFILQTFIENVLKHSMKKYTEINILISIRAIKNQYGGIAVIRINDNGKGFSEEALKKINSTNTNKFAENHIGVWNLKQRLKIIYGEEASITASNNENLGACIEIKIPIEKEMNLI